MAALKSLGTELTDDTKKFMKTFSEKYVEYIVFSRLQSRLKAAVTKALNDETTDNENKDDTENKDDKSDNADTDTTTTTTTEEDTNTNEKGGSGRSKADENGLLDQPPEDESEPTANMDGLDLNNNDENEKTDDIDDSTKKNKDEDDEMEPETPHVGDSDNDSDVKDNENENDDNNNDDDDDDENDNNDNENDMKEKDIMFGEMDDEDTKNTIQTEDVTTDNVNDDIFDNNDNNDQPPPPSGFDDPGTTDDASNNDNEDDTVTTEVVDSKTEDTKVKDNDNDGAVAVAVAAEDVADTTVISNDNDNDDSGKKESKESEMDDNEADSSKKETESKSNVEDESKTTENTDDNDNSKKIGIERVLPIIDVSCEKWESETGPDGDEYTAYKLIFIKLTNNNEFPSRLGIKMSRFRKLHAFNESFSKYLTKDCAGAPREDLVKELKGKFPKKTFFWEKKDEKLKETRTTQISEYMNFCSNDEFLSHQTMFQEFFGLKDDPDKEANMKVFHKALLKACEAEHFFPPSPWELGKYDNENDQLICTVMHMLRDKIDAKARDILGTATGALKNGINKGINKTCGKAVSSAVTTYWKVIDSSRDKITDGVDKALEGENGKKLDAVLNKAAGLAAPLVKKLFKKKDKKKDDDDDSTVETKTDDDTEKESNKKEEDDEFKYDLRVDEIVTLNNLKCELSENMEGDWSAILNGYDQKCWDRLFNNFELEREKHFRYKLKPDLDYLPDFNSIEYNHNSRVCRAIVHLYRAGYSMIKETMDRYLIYIQQNATADSAIDSKKHEEELLKILRENGNTIAAKTAECEKVLINTVHGMTPTGGSKLLDKPKKIGGFVGNFLTQLSVDFSNLNNISSGEDIRKHFIEIASENMNVFMTQCTKELLNGLYDATYADMCTIIEKDLNNALENLERHGLEALDFLPSLITKYISFVSILEKVTDVAVEILLKKALKSKRKALETEFYDSIRPHSMITE